MKSILIHVQPQLEKKASIKGTKKQRRWNQITKLGNQLTNWANCKLARILSTQRRGTTINFFEFESNFISLIIFYELFIGKAIGKPQQIVSALHYVLLIFVSNHPSQIYNINFKMNGEIDCEKVIQRQFKGVDYVITLRADREGLNIQLESKFQGEIWQCYYDPACIEQITTKAGSTKKYNKFVQMIAKALPKVFVGDGYELSVYLLTHQDLEAEASRKNGNIPRSSDPKLIYKRYLILQYISTYDKARYPIPLDYIQDPESERLKLTIRRLAQQLKYSQSTLRPDGLLKEISAIKHENQLLKSKIRSSQKFQSKQNHNTNSKELQQQNKQLRQQIQQLKKSKEQQLGKKAKIIEEKEKTLSEYEIKIKNLEELKHQYKLYEDKFTQLSKQTTELASALQHSRENEKKSQLKITNLEKELEKIMIQIKGKGKNSLAVSKNSLNSPRKSDTGSIKSNNSKKQTNKNMVRNNSSIYDSDTESSRMRKNNIGRASPYRQNPKPNNKSNSAKKKQTQRSNVISKYSNISNLYNKQRGRSRSKSKSVRKQQSPPSDNFQSSAILTQGLDYPSDNEQENKVSQTMARLRNHRNKKITEQKNKVKEKKSNYNPIEQKISSIASLMRNFRNSSHNNLQLENRN